MIYKKPFNLVKYLKKKTRRNRAGNKSKISLPTW